MQFRADYSQESCLFIPILHSLFQPLDRLWWCYRSAFKNTNQSSLTSFGCRCAFWLFDTVKTVFLVGDLYLSSNIHSYFKRNVRKNLSSRCLFSGMLRIFRRVCDTGELSFLIWKRGSDRAFPCVKEKKNRNCNNASHGPVRLKQYSLDELINQTCRIVI